MAELTNLLLLLLGIAFAVLMIGNNCFSWTVKQWVRAGGYIAVRWSYYGKWLHFSWLSKDHSTFLSFVPRDSIERSEWLAMSGWKKLVWLKFGKRLFHFDGVVITESILPH